MKGNDVLKRLKDKKKSSKVIIIAALLVLMIAAPYFVIAGAIMLALKVGFAEAVKSTILYAIWIFVEVAMIALLLFELRVLGSRRVLKVNNSLENSHFMSFGELKRDSGFTVTSLSKLSNVKDGILIWAERKENDINIVLGEAIHTMIIATTGTGKTTSYIEPQIEILARTSTKPCMIIADPKGELYSRHSANLAEQGYAVHLIDLHDTYRSTLWNPFNDIMQRTDEVREAIKPYRGKYEFLGKVYKTEKEAMEAKTEIAVRLKDEVFDDLKDLVYAMCPVKSVNDPSWEQGARNLILGMTLRFWEDYRDGFLPKEKFNLYNLWWNLTEYANDKDSECSLLKAYINEISDTNTRAKSMASTVLVSQDKTLTSFLGSLNQYLNILADGGIAQITSGNEINFLNWDEQPNVLFMKIPDHKEGRHSLVTLLVVQLYKALIEKATRNKMSGATDDYVLKRNCYFIMDEFGNLPKISDFEKKITIARSRGIFFELVVQSFQQLENVYGKSPAEIIKGNTNIKVFMGTDDQTTLSAMSESYGKHKVKGVSYNEEKGMSVSTSAQSVPLIYPSELSKLNEPKNGIFGNQIVSGVGFFPIKSQTTPYFKALDLYGSGLDAAPPEKDFMIFNEQENRYDIARLVAYLKIDEKLSIGDEEQAQEQGERLAEKADEVVSQVAANIVLKRIYGALEKLKDKLSLEDYMRLATASWQNKIAILGEFAEIAAGSNNMFLSSTLENIRSLLLYNLSDLEKSEQIEISEAFK